MSLLEKAKAKCLQSSESGVLSDLRVRERFLKEVISEVGLEDK